MDITTDKKPYVAAVIVAAGNSTRMSLSVSKQLIPLLGISVIGRTLMAFEKAQSISEIVVVCRDGDRNEIEEIAHSLSIGKLKGFASGGSTRGESVSAGVGELSDKVTHIAIHDGARALVTSNEINDVVMSAIEHNAATLAVPVVDTVKIVDESGVIVSTPDRASLVSAQTPQVFEKELYLRAMRSSEGMSFTDDCAIVESIGEKIHTVIGEYTNIKITTPKDIPLAEEILRQRGAVEW